MKIYYYTLYSIALLSGAFSMIFFCSSLFLSLDPANILNAFTLMTCAFGSLFLAFMTGLIVEDLRIRKHY